MQNTKSVEVSFCGRRSLNCGDEYSRVQLFTYTLVVGIGVLVVCGAGHPTVEAAENLFGR